MENRQSKVRTTINLIEGGSCSQQLPPSKHNQGKLAMSNCGIYRIRNTRNDKFYIGSTVDFVYRKWQHFDALKNGNHNDNMQSDYNKTADKNVFLFEKILICCPQDRIFYEQFFIDNLKPELNVSKKAGVLEMTDKIKNKIRIAQLENWSGNKDRKLKASQTTSIYMADYHIKEKQKSGLRKAWNTQRKMNQSIMLLGNNNPVKCPKIRKKISETKRNNIQHICRLSWYNASVMQQKYWGA